MALDEGGGPGFGTGGAPPPPPTGITPWAASPPNIIAAAVNASNNPVTQIPDYASLLNQYMSPYQDMVNQQLAMLQEQMNKQSGFAQDEYGINSDIASGQHKDALREIINMLASRGMLESGDKKWRTNKENTRYKQQTGLLQNALNRYLYGLQSSYQNASMSANSGLAAQRAQLGWQLEQMYPPTAYPSAVNQFMVNRQPYVQPTR